MNVRRGSVIHSPLTYDLQLTRRIKIPCVTLPRRLVFTIIALIAFRTTYCLTYLIAKS